MAGFEKSKAFIPWLIIIGLWATLHGALAVSVASPVFEGQLPGPDEHMHLARVAELRDGNGWYDTVIERSNAPYGGATDDSRSFLAAGAGSRNSIEKRHRDDGR